MDMLADLKMRAKEGDMKLTEINVNIHCTCMQNEIHTLILQM